MSTVRLTARDVALALGIAGARGESAGELARKMLIAAHVAGAAEMTDAEALSTLIDAYAGAAGSIIQGGAHETWSSTAYPYLRVAFVFQDAANKIHGFITTGSRAYFDSVHVEGDIAGPMIEAGTTALARSMATMSRPHNLQIAPMSEDYIAVLGYGQSLMAGQVGEPGIRFGIDDPQASSPAARMIGASTRPQGTQENNFWPIGIDRTAYASTMATYVAAIANAGILTQLQGTTLDRAGVRTAVLSQPTIEAIVSGTDDYEGQDPVTAFTDHVARRVRQKSPLAGQLVVGANSAAGGRVYEQLQKVPPAPDTSRWGRLTDARDIVGRIATVGGKTAAVGAVSIVGGQFNYNKFDDDLDLSAYQDSSYPYADLVGTWAQSAVDVEAVVQGIGEDMQADLRCAGQALPPALFFDQPSGRFTRDNARLGVGMGVLNAVLKNRERGWIGAHSDYPGPDWGGHMKPNGYRWRGVQIAKVMARVLVDRLAWDVFAPYLVETIGNRFYVHYSPPVPPIRRRAIFGADGTAVDFPDDWGCRFEASPDSGDWLGIDDVRVQDGCILTGRLSRTPTEGAVLWQGDLDLHGGATNIADSDETTIEQAYTVTSWMTLEDAGDLATLVGRRYPLQNFAWCGYFPMGWTRPEAV